MSYNPYQQLTPELERAINERVDQRYAAKSKTTVWYNPVDECYYSANDPASMEPDYGVRITEPGKLKGLDRSKYNRPQTQTLLAGGTATMSATELDEARYKGIWSQEFESQAIGFYDRFDRARRQYYNDKDKAKFLGAGTITTQDYAATIGNVMIDQTVLDLISRDFVVLDAVTRKPWDKTVYKFDNRTPYRNTGGLAELDTAPSTSVLYARGSISLKKAEGRVSVSIWANMAVLDHDVVGDNEGIIDADFERIFATDVVATLTGFTDNATAGAYDVIGATAFHSTTNPALLFDEDSGDIRTAGGKSDTLVMRTIDYRALMQNTFMRLSGSPVGAVGTPIPATHAFTTTHTLLPGYTIYVDELATSDSIFIYDKRSVVFLEGPTSVRTVESNLGQVRDTVSDRWYGSGIKVSTWGLQETNIHT
jgi:hypothetical protein